MSDSTLFTPPTGPQLSLAAATARGQDTCEECVGSGGWFRYEPALAPAPGLLYLSCIQCRGSGRTASGQA
jgi:DnaJ-class molecular chaperone